DEDTDRLAGAAREHDRAADDLVGMTRIDAQADGDLDRFIELGVGGALHELERGLRVVQRGGVDLAGGRAVLLAVRLHPFTSTPIERAAPATIAIAPSRESV